MSRPIARWFAGLVLIASTLTAGQEFAAADDTAANPQPAPQKQAVVAAPATARTAYRAPATTRTYRGRRPMNTSSTGRRWSYNYSGVGFPRMEGGLTAAANRTTWLKKP
jgi:hypothetical protein